MEVITLARAIAWWCSIRAARSPGARRARSPAIRRSSRPISAARRTVGARGAAERRRDRAPQVDHLEVRYGDLIGVADVSLDGAGGRGGGAARLQRRRQDHDAQRHRRLIRVAGGSITFGGERIDGQPAYAIVRKGLALSPEGWRLFAQQSVENNLLLGATPLADRIAHPRSCSTASMRCSRASPSAAISAPARCPAASARCSRSAAR